MFLEEAKKGQSSQGEHPQGVTMSRDLNMEVHQSAEDLREETSGAEHDDGERQVCPRESVQSTVPLVALQQQTVKVEV